MNLNLQKLSSTKRKPLNNPIEHNNFNSKTKIEIDDMCYSKQNSYQTNFQSLKFYNDHADISINGRISGNSCPFEDIVTFMSGKVNFNNEFLHLLDIQHTRQDIEIIIKFKNIQNSAIQDILGKPININNFNETMKYEGISILEKIDLNNSISSVIIRLIGKIEPEYSILNLIKNYKSKLQIGDRILDKSRMTNCISHNESSIDYNISKKDKDIKQSQFRTEDEVNRLIKEMEIEENEWRREQQIIIDKSIEKSNIRSNINIDFKANIESINYNTTNQHYYITTISDYIQELTKYRSNELSQYTYTKIITDYCSKLIKLRETSEYRLYPINNLLDTLELFRVLYLNPYDQIYKEENKRIEIDLLSLQNYNYRKTKLIQWLTLQVKAENRFDERDCLYNRLLKLVIQGDLLKAINLCNENSLYEMADIILCRDSYKVNEYKQSTIAHKFESVEPHLKVIFNLLHNKIQFSKIKELYNKISWKEYLLCVLLYSNNNSLQEAYGLFEKGYDISGVDDRNLYLIESFVYFKTKFTKSIKKFFLSEVFNTNSLIINLITSSILVSIIPSLSITLNEAIELSTLEAYLTQGLINFSLEFSNFENGAIYTYNLLQTYSNYIFSKNIETELFSNYLFSIYQLYDFEQLILNSDFIFEIKSKLINAHLSIKANKYLSQHDYHNAFINYVKSNEFNRAENVLINNIFYENFVKCSVKNVHKLHLDNEACCSFIELNKFFAELTPHSNKIANWNNHLSLVNEALRIIIEFNQEPDFKRHNNKEFIDRLVNLLKSLYSNFTNVNYISTIPFNKQFIKGSRDFLIYKVKQILNYICMRNNNDILTDHTTQIKYIELYPFTYDNKVSHMINKLDYNDGYDLYLDYLSHLFKK